MLRFVDYIAIGGTALLLGGAVLSSFAAAAISIYLGCRFSLNDLQRFASYAKLEAPPEYHIAPFWFFRLNVICLALALAEIVFMLVLVGCFGEQ